MVKRERDFDEQDDNSGSGVIRVNDRRHSARISDEVEEDAQGEPAEPSAVQELRRRAEEAERRQREYADAFRQAQAEQEQFRERTARDVERRVALQFGSLVAGLVESLDDLELALSHAAAHPEARAIAEGVMLARDRFVAALQRAGVERIDPAGEPFDPAVAEALRLAPVDDAQRDGLVVEVLRPGYRLGERVIRPAQVAVGRHGS
jgi:molecular chaperone GrpE